MGLKASISRKLLKEKIGDENIFNHYFGQPINLSQSYHSVFREDKKKSTGFYVSEHGSLIYNDFTTSEKYDFVQFVMKLYGLNYYDALRQIAVDFDLTPGNKSSEKTAVIKQINNKVKLEKIIDIDVVPFKKYHYRYWADFYITPEELKLNNVFAVGGFTIKTKEKETYVHTEGNTLRFAYLFFDNNNKGYTKIYTPHDANYKWVGNVPLALVYGMSTLPFASDTLYITKSVKDYIILKKYFTDVVALQNESPAALTKDYATAFGKCYKKVVLLFDMDRPGIRAANYYKKEYRFVPYFMGSTKKSLWKNIISAKTNKTKDCSDFVKRYGLDVFKQYLEHLKLL